jgi:capsular polysaccharide biosynthesis protein
MDIDKVSNVGVVQRPTAPLTPVKPKKILNLLLGLFAGLFGGLFFAFVLELIDDAIETEEDVKRYLGVPVLAWVSEKEFKACT